MRSTFAFQIAELLISASKNKNRENFLVKREKIERRKALRSGKWKRIPETSSEELVTNNLPESRRTALAGEQGDYRPFGSPLHVRWWSSIIRRGGQYGVAPRARNRLRGGGWGQSETPSAWNGASNLLQPPRQCRWRKRGGCRIWAVVANPHPHLAGFLRRAIRTWEFFLKREWTTKKWIYTFLCSYDFHFSFAEPKWRFSSPQIAGQKLAWEE